MLAEIEGSQTPFELFVELTKLRGAGLFVLFEEAECFPDYFAGGVVATRAHLVVNELFEIGTRP